MLRHLVFCHALFKPPNSCAIRAAARTPPPSARIARPGWTRTGLWRGSGSGGDIILANRMRLEEQTGADLIYFNATFRSFVMVQYKAMEMKAS